MKAIIIKVNEKVIGVSKIDEITTKQFLDLQKDVAKTWNEKDKQVIALENEVSRLGEYTKELEAKINYLGKQIAIDRGEIEEDYKDEYEIVIKGKDEEPVIEEIEHPTLEEDAKIVEPEVSPEEDAYFEESEVTE